MASASSPSAACGFACGTLPPVERYASSSQAQSRIIDGTRHSKDGKLLVTNDDQLARLWDTDTGNEIRTFKGHTHGVTSVLLSPDGKQLATAGGLDNTVILWDLATGKEIRSFKGAIGNVFGAIPPQDGALESAAMTPDGKRLATAGSDGAARIWDVATGKEVRVLRGSDTLAVHVTAVSPDGAWLINRRQNTVDLWDMSAGKPVRSFETDAVWRSVSLAPGGKRLVALGADGQSAQVWDTVTGKALRTYKGLTGFATLSADGSRLVTGDQQKLAWLWDVDTGKAIFVHSRGTLAWLRAPRCRTTANGLSPPVTPRPDSGTCAPDS